MSFPPLTLFPIGRNPTRPGGGGATPTLKTHDEAYSTPGRIQTERNLSKPNETKKKTVSSEKLKV